MHTSTDSVGQHFYHCIFFLSQNFLNDRFLHFLFFRFRKHFFTYFFQLTLMLSYICFVTVCLIFSFHFCSAEIFISKSSHDHLLQRCCHSELLEVHSIVAVTLSYAFVLSQFKQPFVRCCNCCIY